MNALEEEILQKMDWELKKGISPMGFSTIWMEESGIFAPRFDRVYCEALTLETWFLETEEKMGSPDCISPFDM